MNSKKAPAFAAQEEARRFPVGAEVLAGGVSFRVWASKRRRVELVVERDPRSQIDSSYAVVALEPEGDGHFSKTVTGVGPGTLYRYRLDGEESLCADPASRFQPDGPHGPSQVINARTFKWQDHNWQGVTREGQVLYEMHIGTFTPEGTWKSAARELPALADLGITVLEIMPINDFPGRFGWGYDGVNLFAPSRLYGTPDDCRRFVDQAHRAGIGVILDVVYNHIGPDGNVLPRFSPEYFTDRYTTDWGEAINCAGENAGPVREFFITNAGYWIAYYTDYYGTPQEFISAFKYGYLYQGQYYKWQKNPRGTPALDLDPAVFVTFLQNHDQVANSGLGLRCHALTSPGRYRAMTALMLLGPATPMLFQGQEFAASSPFFYFADFSGELESLTYEGRGKQLSQFLTLAEPEIQALLVNPADPDTFARSKLDLSERQRNANIYALHRDLLRLRREEPVFRAQRRGGMDGAVLGSEAFALRFFGANCDDRLLMVNLGRDLNLSPAPEPLLAPPENKSWEILWSSEDPRYGGSGTAPLEAKDYWHMPGHAAVVLKPAGLQGD